MTRPHELLPYDPVGPPEHPPAGADVMMWRLGYRLWTDHQPGPSGQCRICLPPAWPCPARELAGAGLMAAVLMVPLSPDQVEHAARYGPRPQVVDLPGRRPTPNAPSHWRRTGES